MIIAFACNIQFSSPVFKVSENNFCLFHIVFTVSRNIEAVGQCLLSKSDSTKHHKSLANL